METQAADENPREKIDLEDLPDFDVAEMLDSDEAIAAYLNEFLAEEDPAVLAEALGVVARAHGMTEMAKKSGLTREALYKALRPKTAPRMDTIMKVMKAFGLKLVAQPIAARPAPVDLTSELTRSVGRLGAQNKANVTSVGALTALHLSVVDLLRNHGESNIVKAGNVSVSYADSKPLVDAIQPTKVSFENLPTLPQSVSNP